MATGGENTVTATTKEGEIERQYKFGRTLGSGTFATVKQATCLADQTKWAVKVIKKSALTAEDEESLKMEIQILHLTHHPNIVAVKEVFYSKQYVYLVMDIMTGGELFDRIVNKDHYTENEAKQALREITIAIQYCHDKNIVHRDLKPENLLLASRDDDSDIKVADFGFAIYAEGYSITSQCGTPGYIAPEILKSKPYGKPADMWSFGVILYILLGGYPPFHDDNQRTLFRKICKGDYTFHPDYWSGVSDDAKDLIRGLLVVDHTKRLTVEQAIAHPWLGKSQEELAKFSLDSNLATLRKFQATRKLRAAVHTVIAANRMKNLLGMIRDAAAVIAEDDEEAERLASVRPAETA
mmetsp:Transcript_24853/g.55829  ORF Transcript_24853/g.55829 Transcript_24853/m.55829 type:complete len:353 (+) Transcript_24853:203-1261(+)